MPVVARPREGRRPVFTARPAISALGLGLLALTICGLAGAARASTILDYVTLDGIDYIRFGDEAGRALARGDLGAEFATIACSFGEDLRGCPFGTDAGAAFMPAGTRMYAVKGYATEFRLAAVWRDRIFLYQAWRNPRAKVGGDLYRIGGRARGIDVQRAGESPGPVRAVPTADAAALVDMLLRAPIEAPRGHPLSDPRYLLTFWLDDGTALVRPFFPESGDLMGGVIPPPEFRRVLERTLGD